MTVALSMAALLPLSVQATGAAVGKPAGSSSAAVGFGDLERAAPVDRRCIAKRPELRRRVAERRGATWRWQELLEFRRTPSAFRERVALGCDYLRWLGGRWALRADEHWRLYASLRDPAKAICHVFGDRCREALGVAWCESRFDVNARNGQYLGLFQMGSSERRRFGHGDTALEQARAAKRYHAVAGWGPWQCLPSGGLRW